MALKLASVTLAGRSTIPDLVRSGVIHIFS